MICSLTLTSNYILGLASNLHIKCLVRNVFPTFEKQAKGQLLYPEMFDRIKS